MTNHHNSYLIALGSNATADLTSNTALLMDSVARMKAYGLDMGTLSRFFKTPAYPAGSGPDYVNACARVHGPADPHAVLDVLHAVEADMGRVRDKRWGQRVIDLDLLAAGDRVLPDAKSVQTWIDLPLDQQMQRAPERLIVPHPRLQDRGFVLVPLADVAPDWVHPVLGLSVRQMKAALGAGEIATIEPI